MKKYSVIITMPAYYAEKTIKNTLDSLPKSYDHIILCDDASMDQTSAVSESLGIETHIHTSNLGYGGNQKTLYKKALEYNPDVIIMVHPDNQYDVSCIPDMIKKIKEGGIDLVLGSRMKTARKNGMPMWRYLGNIFLSFLENITFNTSVSEFHSGFRGYKADSLKKIDFEKFSNDFVFDTEMIASFAVKKMKISEVDTQCFYREDVSSISFKRSVIYGLSTLKVLFNTKIGKYS